jgi:flagellar hook assembly protein FlgD
LGAFPNPFRSRTTIRFELEAPGPVRIDIFDLAGRRVRTLERLQLPAGTGEVVWNGRSDGGDRVAPGIYFFRRSGSGSSEGGRVVVLR